MALELAGPVSGEWTQGNDIQLTFTVTKDGVAQNINGATPKFAMARRSTGAAVVSTETSPATATANITDGPNGVFTIDIADTANIGLLGNYVWQAQVVDAAGDKSNILHGYGTFKEQMIA